VEARKVLLAFQVPVRRREGKLQLVVCSTENAACVEAVIGEDSGGEVTGFSHLANGEDGLGDIELG
jgi:hypothetical protein